MDDLTTCKIAAGETGHRFKYTEYEAGWPKGCYEGYGVVNFNHHIDGSKNNLARQICKRVGKGLRSFPTFMYLL